MAKTFFFIINEHLEWKYHLDMFKIKISSGNYVSKSLNNILTTSILTTIYHDLLFLYLYKIIILHHGMQSFHIIVYCTPVYCTLVISGETSGHNISGTSIGGTTFSNIIFLVDLDLLFHNLTLVLQFSVAS